MSVDRYKGVVFNPADLAEDVDLDVDRRKEILFAEASLPTATHYQLLGLPWNAPGASAKAAYLEKVKVFHPDRYAGKRLGSYRTRLEKVFRRLTEARDVLTDEAKRVAYARATAPVLEVAKLEARKLEDEKRSEERRARLARQNPLLARASRVAELLKRGKEGMESGHFQQAANDFQLVASLDPTHKEALALAAEARKKSAGAKVQEAIEKGQQAELVGNAGAALAAYRAALEADPGHLRAAVLATRAAIQARDLNGAREHGEAAVRIGPRSGAAHEALGLALAEAGQAKEAKKVLEKALDLDPKLEQAKERLKKLRWSFLG